MIYTVIGLVLCAVALVLTFAAKPICRFVGKGEEPAEEKVMHVKLAALAVAIAALVLIFALGQPLKLF